MITAILIKGPGPAPFYATRQRRGIEIWSLARVSDQEEVKIVVWNFSGSWIGFFKKGIIQEDSFVGRLGNMVLVEQYLEFYFYDP